MILGLVLFAVLSPTLSSAPRPPPRLPAGKYDNITLPRPRIPDRDLIIEDISAFARRHGSPAAGKKPALRLAPITYYEKYNRRIRYVKLIDLMKHALYHAQDRLKYLHGMLKKYQNDQTFRVGFIFAKLNQLVEDMRRVYSYAYHQYGKRAVYYHIFYYTHVVKKNIDVTYIVEYMYVFHQQNMDLVKEFQQQVSAAYGPAVSATPAEK